MTDENTRLPVFCIADIPASNLNLLLQYADEYLGYFNKPWDIAYASDYIVFIDSKNISSVTIMTGGSTVASTPTTFVGETVQQVRDWFKANVTQPRREGFFQHCFLVLDNQTNEDESCLFVCTQDGPSHSLRCGLDLALKIAMACDAGDSIGDGTMGCFMRSGVIMTKENDKLASSGGVYIEGGEVKLDQEWRDFLNW